MLAIEDRSRFSDGILPPGKRVDIHLGVMARNRLRGVADFQSPRLQPVRQLDVLPRGRGKGGVEGMLEKKLPIDGDLGGVEKIKRNDAAILDEPIPELQSVVVD